MQSDTSMIRLVVAETVQRLEVIYGLSEIVTPASLSGWLGGESDE